MTASCVFGNGLGKKKIKMIYDKIPYILNLYKNNDIYNIILNLHGFNKITS
jgi:hypothetical protein